MLSEGYTIFGSDLWFDAGPWLVLVNPSGNYVKICFLTVNQDLTFFIQVVQNYFLDSPTFVTKCYYTLIKSNNIVHVWDGVFQLF